MSAAVREMASEESAVGEKRTHHAPEVVAPTTRVNVALPFSKIAIEEPGQELIELAAIVAGLAAAIEQAVPEASLLELRERADALMARLRR